MTNVSSLPNENVKLPWQENFCSARHCDFWFLLFRGLLYNQGFGETCRTVLWRSLPHTGCSANCFAKAASRLLRCIFSGKAYVREGLFHTRHFVWFDMKRFGKLIA